MLVPECLSGLPQKLSWQNLLMLCRTPPSAWAAAMLFSMHIGIPSPLLPVISQRATAATLLPRI